MSLSWPDLTALPLIERQVRMDCVGGFRNNPIMAGVAVQHILDQAGVDLQARRVVFHCLDGYFASLELKDLRESEAFLAHTTNEETLPKFGYPLRLAMPGKYGYQWAKWVHRLEVVTDGRKGYWAELSGRVFRATLLIEDHYRFYLHVQPWFSQGADLDERVGRILPLEILGE